MKSIGSPVKVGKMDATSYSSKHLLSLLFYVLIVEMAYLTWSSIQGRRKKYLLFTQVN